MTVDSRIIKLKFDNVKCLKRDIYLTNCKELIPKVFKNAYVLKNVDWWSLDAVLLEFLEKEDIYTLFNIPIRRLYSYYDKNNDYSKFIEILSKAKSNIEKYPYTIIPFEVVNSSDGTPNFSINTAILGLDISSDSLIRVRKYTYTARSSYGTSLENEDLRSIRYTLLEKLGKKDLAIFKVITDKLSCAEIVHDNKFIGGTCELCDNLFEKLSGECNTKLKEHILHRRRKYGYSVNNFYKCLPKINFSLSTSVEGFEV